jgi:Family of unknown function (DUF7033)
MPDLQYRLSIAPMLERFRPEIEHACGFLDACYEIVRNDQSPRVLHYGDAPPAGAIAVPAVLFPVCVRIDRDGIHPEHTALAPAATAGRLLPTDPSTVENVFQYDALGLIFFLLSRLEERDHPARDRYQRFPVRAAHVPPEQGRLYPWADRAARDLAKAITGSAEPPQRTRYQIKVTHDIDTLKGYHRPLEPLRGAIGDVVKRVDPIGAWQRFRRGYLGGEPFSSMNRLMALSERHNLKSHFYYMGPSDDMMDSSYAMRWPLLTRKTADQIRARGHGLGFHPGFRTFNDASEWMRQRDGIEAIIDAPLREGRHHVLRYDCAITPRIWSDAGMLLDCTLAYPEVVGFRSGTCRAHQAYDLVARQSLPLKQISTAVMDFGLFGGKYRDLSVEQAVSDALWAAGVCRQYGGTYTLLFHSGQSDARLWAWLEQVIGTVA